VEIVLMKPRQRRVDDKHASRSGIRVLTYNIFRIFLAAFPDIFDNFSFDSTSLTLACQNAIQIGHVSFVRRVLGAEAENGIGRTPHFGKCPRHRPICLQLMTNICLPAWKTHGPPLSLLWDLLALRN